MSMKGFTRRFRPLELLSEEHVEAIHRATLAVLSRTGVRFESEKALNLFKDHGCDVDADEMRVRFPEALVEESLRKCPSSFRVRAREPKNDLVIGGNTVYFMAFPGMRTVDLDTWEPRTPTRSETYEAVAVLDALDNLNCIGPYTPYFGFAGVPQVMLVPENVVANIRHSTKVQRTVQRGEMFSIAMAQAAGTEIIGGCTAAPPMTFYQDAVESTFRVCEAGLPLHVISGGLMGATGPATLAGATVTNNVELLAGLVMAQLIRPGTRVLVDHFVFPMNMRTGSPDFGAIGISLHQVAFNQIWRRYGVPIVNAAGACSASKAIDFQNGYEKAMAALTAALSGANIIHLHGAVHGELTYHPVQSVLDDDVAGMIGRFLEGIEVTDATLAMNLIGEVGPIPGNYMVTEHTRAWWKEEQFIPKAADKLTYPEWMDKGRKTTLEYAEERVQEILATREPTLLSPSEEETVEKVLNEARRYYREKGLISDSEWTEYMKQIESPGYPYA